MARTSLSQPPHPKSLSLRPAPIMRESPEEAGDWRPAFDAAIRAMFLRRLRVATVVLLVLHTVAFFALPAPHATTSGNAVRIGIIPLTLLLFGATYLPRAKRHGRSLAVALLLSLAAFIIWFNHQIGRPLETSALLLLLPMSATLFPFTLRATAIIASLTSAMYFVYPLILLGYGRMTEILGGGFYVAAAGLLACVGASVSYRLREREFRAQRDEHIAHEKAETLLRNTLPASIVERLKNDPGAIADDYEAVTVLFADIASFTELSAALSPEELVRFLNHLFSELDKLTERFGLEKIKTIGDAYMVAGGLPEPRADHAEAVARMALVMLELAASETTPSGDPLSIRIGIHSGPVVAGVIGARKYNYDLWGDTVNTASRMESHAAPGTIQVSRATYDLLRDRFELEPRGEIEVKGKGKMNTYLLLGE